MVQGLVSTKDSQILLVQACDSAVRPCGCGPRWFQILSADGSDRTLPEVEGELCHLRGHFPSGSESHQDWPAI